MKTTPPPQQPPNVDRPESQKEEIPPLPETTTFKEAAAALKAPFPTSTGIFWPTLPNTTGPYYAGCTDFEWAEATYEPRIVAREPVRNGLLVRFYYPSTPKVQGKPRVKPKDWMTAAEAKWLTGWRYALGYGDFLQLPRAVSIGIFTPLLSSLTIRDVFAEVPLLQEDRKLPVIVFSHGLGGNRTTYSTICAEMASYGWIVAAVEHRDGSASMTVVDDDTVPIPLRRPVPEKEDEFQFRNGQVNLRSDECFKTLELLHKLNSGESVKNIRSSSKFDFNSLKSRLDFDRLAIAGHSFGGATVVTACCSPSSAPHVFRCGIVLDGWMFPVDKSNIHNLHAPLLFINSFNFHWEKNIQEMRATINADASERSILCCIRETGHQNQSDFPLLFPFLLQKLNMAGRINPIQGIHLNNRAMLHFLHRMIPDQDAKAEWYHADNILDQSRTTRPEQIILDTDPEGVPFYKNKN